MPGKISSEFLRTRYFDWCSAKVAERFLHLSPDEIWNRSVQLREEVSSAEKSAGEGEAFPTGSAFLLARALAAKLAHELELPSLAEWSERYVADPAPFERDIVVFERPVLGSEESSAPR